MHIHTLVLCFITYCHSWALVYEKSSQLVEDKSMGGWIFVTLKYGKVVITNSIPYLFLYDQLESFCVVTFHLRRSWPFLLFCIVICKLKCFLGLKCKLITKTLRTYTMHSKMSTEDNPVFIDRLIFSLFHSYTLTFILPKVGWAFIKKLVGSTISFTETDTIPNARVGDDSRFATPSY